MDNDLVWRSYWNDVGGEAYLAAKALLDLSPSVRRDVAQWMTTTTGSRPRLEWDAWIADVDERGRGWSSTEHRLFEIVASLVSVEPRSIPLRGLLDCMGSWETDVWRILTEWGTGGNNRDLPGRATAVPRRP